MIRIARFSYLCVLVFAAVSTGASAQFTVLHTFSGADGSSPTGLIQTTDGSFYGAGSNGGDFNTCSPDGCGVLFKIASAGHFTVLHVFHATDGSLPTGLVKGLDGNFYGTTMSGGQPSGGGAGTIFRLDPAGNFTVLYAFVGGFACCDGAGPTAHLIQASNGNFYGTTGAGGQFRDIDHQGGFGTVFQFNPVSGAVTILHSFNLPDGNGIFPNGPLIQATDGFLYGTTREGGATAFRIDTAGNFSLLAHLPGTQPLAGLIQAGDGNFYGTDEGGSGGGSVFRITPAGAFSIINRFDGADGWRPHFGLLQAADGFFYGTAPQGGLLDFQGGDVFRIDATGNLSVLHSFLTTGPEGFIPNSQLIPGADGTLYGTAGLGGASNRGTIFRFDQRVPGAIASVSVKPAVVVSGLRATGTVKLSSPAPAGGMIVNLGAQQGQIVIPTKVTVRAGALKRSFTIKTLHIAAAATVRIYAHAAGQGVRTTITVTP